MAQLANQVIRPPHPHRRLPGSARPSNDNLTTYQYDGHDRLQKTRFPLPAKGANASSTTDYEQLTYDLAGNVTARRNRAGQTVNFTYDNLNRATLKNLVTGEPDVTYAYDNLGRLTSASQTGHALSFTYDALSRNLTQAGPQGTVTSEWDLAGRRTRLTYPGTGFYVDYDYLVTGDMTKVRENGDTSGIGVLATYGYDNSGRRTSATFGNGVAQAFTFDPVSRLATLTNNLSGTTNDLSATFAHSPASQIASTVRTGDAYAWTGHFNQNASSTANGLNQIANFGAKTVTHDNKGNITAIETKSFTYSSENLPLTGPNSTTLSYDPVMRLYQTASGGTTSRFAYDGLDRIAEYDGANALQRRYVHGPAMDEPILWYEGSGTTDRRFLSADERGSIVSVTDSAGALLGLNRYDEFGQPQSTNLGKFGYTGQAWLPEIGVWYYKARVYDSELGRFLQTDPIGYEDSPNLYAYVLNDPINLVDPLGLDCLGQPDVGPCAPIDVVGSRGCVTRYYSSSMSSVCLGPLTYAPPWASGGSGSGGGGASGMGVGGNDPKPKEEEKRKPLCGKSNDLAESALYVLDFAGSVADVASLGLAAASAGTGGPTNPVGGSFAVGAVVANRVSAGFSGLQIPINLAVGNYRGALANVAGLAVGNWGSRLAARALGVQPPTGITEDIANNAASQVASRASGC